MASERDGIRADIVARVFLTLGALLPYWRLLTFSAIFVTDDGFASDIFNGELPGRAFGGSGYIACQLKHLGIVSTIVWLPVGLAFIDRTLGASVDAPPPTAARRALFMAAFGLVFAEQVLCGFPQSAYICALVYGSFALFCAIANRRRLGPLPGGL